MNVVEALNVRQSIRAYKSDPVPKEILIKVMEAATRAPSWSDTQPWEFTIVGGKVMDELKEALHARAVQGVSGHPDIPYPTIPEPYQSRSRANGGQRYESMGIARDDREHRRDWTLRGVRFFDAPNGIVVYIDKQLGAWSIFDAGLVVQSILLAAAGYGLGTCLAVRMIEQPDELRRILGIPESKLIVIGLSIGYPDWDHPVNKFRSLREPLESVVTWRGL